MSAIRLVASKLSTVTVVCIMPSNQFPPLKTTPTMCTWSFECGVNLPSSTPKTRISGLMTWRVLLVKTLPRRCLELIEWLSYKVSARTMVALNGKPVS